MAENKQADEEMEMAAVQSMPAATNEATLSSTAAAAVAASPSSDPRLPSLLAPPVAYTSTNAAASSSSSSSSSSRLLGAPPAAAFTPTALHLSIAASSGDEPSRPASSSAPAAVAVAAASSSPEGFSNGSNGTGMRHRGASSEGLMSPDSRRPSIAAASSTLPPSPMPAGAAAAGGGGGAAAVRVVRRSILEKQQPDGTTDSSNQTPNKSWVLHPDSLRYRWWLLVMVLTIFANTWSVPFRLSVGYNRIHGEITAFTGTDIIFDFIYILNIVIKSRLAFYEEGALIVDARVIWATYLSRPGGLLLDGCSVLPLDWILLGSGLHIESVFVRLLRLIQLLVVARYLADVETSPGVNVTLVRLAKITGYYLLLSHLVGCIWFSFALPDHFGENNWLPSRALLQHSYMSQYLRVLYWGLATLSDRIESPSPYTASGIAFMISTQIIGVLLLAYIIGNIAFAIDDANETFQRFRLQLDYVQRFMTHSKLPEDMQDRVRKYYDYVWSTNRGFDDMQMLKDLPATLRTDVCLQLTASTVGCNTLFRGLDERFLGALVKVLMQRTLVPEEYLLREGEPGDAMFFLRSGVIVVSVAIKPEEMAEMDELDEGDEDLQNLTPPPPRALVAAPLNNDGHYDTGIGNKSLPAPLQIQISTTDEHGGVHAASLLPQQQQSQQPQQQQPQQQRHRRSSYTPLPRLPRGPPAQRPVQTCVDGDLLGEFCVLLGDQCPVRTSSAMAATYCDLFVLRQDDLAHLLSFYPDVQSELEARTMKRRQLTMRKEETIKRASIGGRRDSAAARRDSAAAAAAAAATAQTPPDASDATTIVVTSSSPDVATSVEKLHQRKSSMKQLQLDSSSGGGVIPASSSSSPLASSSPSASSTSRCVRFHVWLRYQLLMLELWLRVHWLSNSPTYENWTRMIFVISLYNALCVPFRWAFFFRAQHPAMMTVDYFTDCILLFNIFANCWVRQPPKLGNNTLSASSAALTASFRVAAAAVAASSAQANAATASSGSGGRSAVVAPPAAVAPPKTPGNGGTGSFESFASARRRYLRSGWMMWDIATCAPLDFFMLINEEMNPWFRVGRVLRFFTDLRVLSNANLQAAGLNGSTVGLLQLMTGFIMLVHWASCAYWSFSYFIGFGPVNDSTVWLPSGAIHNQGLWSSYLMAQFQTFVLLTGLGQKAPPVSDAEVIYVMVLIMLGILLVAWAVGEVGERIANLDRFNAEFGRQMHNTTEFMAYRHFPSRLRKRVRDYMSHWYSTRRGVDPHAAMEGLPVGLRAEVMTHLCQHVLMKVPLLANLLAADPTSSLGRHLIERLRFDSYPAGELIFQAGEIAETMFFITEGEVGIVLPPAQGVTAPLLRSNRLGASPGGGEFVSEGRLATTTPLPALPKHLQPAHAAPSKILGVGSFFGESGCLSHGLRTASIRALKPTFLLVLSRESLLEIMEAHAEFASHIRQISSRSQTRMRTRKALHRHHHRGCRTEHRGPLGPRHHRQWRCCCHVRPEKMPHHWWLGPNAGWWHPPPLLPLPPPLLLGRS